MAKRKRDVYLSVLLGRLGACQDSLAWVRSRRGAPGGMRATYAAVPANAGWLHWLLCEMYTQKIDGADALYNRWWDGTLGCSASDIRALIPWRDFAPVLQRLADKVMAEPRGRR